MYQFCDFMCHNYRISSQIGSQFYRGVICLLLQVSTKFQQNWATGTRDIRTAQKLLHKTQFQHLLLVQQAVHESLIRDICIPQNALISKRLPVLLKPVKVANVPI